MAALQVFEVTAKIGLQRSRRYTLLGMALQSGDWIKIVSTSDYESASRNCMSEATVFAARW